MKKLLYIVFTFNFLFSLLTAILPLLVVEVTQSPATSGYVLTTFMLALLVSRIFLLKYEVDEYLLLKVGLFLYCTGFLILFIKSTSIIAFYIGAITLGMGVGVVAPILLTIITSRGDNPKKVIGFHNSFLGVASAVAPFLGVFLYYTYSERTFVYLVLLISSLSALAVSYLVKRNGKRKPLRANTLNKQAFSIQYLPSYVTFLLTSISYGAVIAFLPLYLEGLSLRIDIFYFFFWSFFILSQIFMLKLKEYISENLLLSISFLLISSSNLLLILSPGYFLLILSAMIFGFFYGGVMNLFYNRIAVVKETKAKSDAYAIFGLMSYMGVGVGSMLLSPVANYSLVYVFLFSAAFPFVAFGTNAIWDLYKRRHALVETNKEFSSGS